MPSGAASDMDFVATGRRAHIAFRRHVLHAAVGTALLALCVVCCALASSARASTHRSSASTASSYASAPPPPHRRRRTGCARRASFHEAGGVHRGNRGKRHRSSCRGKRHVKRHHRSAQTPAANGACANAQLQPTPTNLALVRAATMCLVNRERTSRGEAPLHFNADLQRSAQAHSSDMASADYFAHESLSGETPLARMRESGYIFSSHIGYAVGENIAWATLWMAAPKAIVAGWMASPGHRANILDATFRDSGVGIAPRPLASLAGGQSGAIYTQDFGRIIRP